MTRKIKCCRTCDTPCVSYKDDNNKWWCYCINSLCDKSRFFTGYGKKSVATKKN